MAPFVDELVVHSRRGGVVRELRAEELEARGGGLQWQAVGGE